MYEALWCGRVNIMLANICYYYASIQIICDKDNENSVKQLRHACMYELKQSQSLICTKKMRINLNFLSIFKQTIMLNSSNRDILFCV